MTSAGHLHDSNGTIAATIIIFISSSCNIADSARLPDYINESIIAW